MISAIDSQVFQALYLRFGTPPPPPTMIAGSCRWSAAINEDWPTL